MLYQQICDNIFEWLTLADSSVDWSEGDQPLENPIPENLPVYGFYRVMSVKNKDMGGLSKKYNEENDNLDTVSYNYQESVITIDVYTTRPRTSTENPISAFDVVNNIFLFANTPDSIEFFQKKNMGYMKVSESRNQQLTVSGQLVRRVQFDLNISTVSELAGTLEVIKTASVTPTITR